jgi:hypothetical protein
MKILFKSCILQTMLHCFAAAVCSISTCQQVRRLRDGPHPAVDLMPTLRGPATVVLAGRATTVPFTTDASGRKRTPTDNPTAAMTCAVRRLAGWQPRPIWLCKQGSTTLRL